MIDPSFDAPTALTAVLPAQASAATIADALKTSELRYRRLFETARDGILILDSDQGKITDANPFMTELLGYSHAELLGKELWEIGLLQDEQASQDAFQQLKQDGYIRYEDLPLENLRGERREVECVSNLYRENGHTVIQCNIRDITDRKRVAGELAIAAKHARHAAVLQERTRLAHEIHDTLAQGFAGITTQLEAADAALANIPEPSAPDSLSIYQTQLGKVQLRIVKARDLARESLDEARRSVAELRSSPLETASLSEALSRFLTQSLVGTTLKSQYVMQGVPAELPVTVEHCLLRISQEAMTNAVEHAQAGEITVTLSFETGQVRLQVCDDGIGFDSHLPRPGRFGILGMRERAEKVQGALSIISDLGTGTEVNLTVPIPPESQESESREQE